MQIFLKKLDKNNNYFLEIYSYLVGCDHVFLVLDNAWSW